MVADSVVVTAGPVFTVSSRSGDIHPRTLEGFYAHDTRFLSSFLLLIEGKCPAYLGSATFDNTLASFYARSSSVRGVPMGTMSITRDRYVAHGLHEDITLVNHSSKPIKIRLELTFDADFADLFEVRLASLRKRRRITVEPREGQHMGLVYRRGRFHRETWIAFSTEPEIHGKIAIFHLNLQPERPWKTCVSVLPVLDVTPEPMKCVEEVLGPPFGAYRRRETSSLSVLRRGETEDPLEELPRLETDHIPLKQAYDQAVRDIRALRMEQEDGHYILAAGLPWFMAVFGRDSITSAIQTKLLGPELMIGTLHTLARFQAIERDDSLDAEPGKILHEIRRGELSLFGEAPNSPYYGSVDATPLFLILLWEAYQWTGDEGLLRRFLPAAEAALRWISRYGDMDGDGFIEYQRKTRKGLRNQCWKDSHDSISFSDGELAAGSIAVAEVQGYVYDAKRKMAEAYRIIGGAAKARALNRQAERLKEQFNEAFWMPNEGYFAVALDGRKRQVNSVASNAGHLLWSGIVDKDKALKVVERLMAPDMFSGWGIRTLSTDMARYDPASYHNGSVWPHDNSLIAAGLSRYGFIREAKEVICALLEAAAAFPDHRLPELFAGYPRREHSFPVPYPLANAPQAWASGAVIYLLETLLGVVPVGDRLLREVSTEGLFASLSGIYYRGSRRIL